MKPTRHAPAMNTGSIEEAFDQYYPAIFYYFRYRGADIDTANDLASATFERALSRLHQYDPQKAQIQTWLFTIAHSLAINNWKAERQDLPLDDDLPAADDLPPEQAVMMSQDKEAVLRALEILDPRSREALALKFGGRLTNRQIASLTGLSESHVGVILYRSLLKLRTMLAEDKQETRNER